MVLSLSLSQVFSAFSELSSGLIIDEERKAEEQQPPVAPCRAAPRGRGRRPTFGSPHAHEDLGRTHGSDHGGQRWCDLDLLVEFEGGTTFDAFMGTKLAIEDALGVRVDLVTRAALKPRLRARIEAEARRVA